MRYLKRLLQQHANGPEIAQILTSLIGVKVSPETLTRNIEEHPDYPSLLSISDVFKQYGIENLGIRINTEQLEAVPTPFITQVKGATEAGDFFTVVKTVSDALIEFFDPEKHRWVVVSKAKFWQRCSGVALLTEVLDNAGEHDYEQKITEQRRNTFYKYAAGISIPALALFAAMLALADFGSQAVLPFLFTLLTLAGGAVSTLLLWYEVDQHNPLLRQICGGGNKINCGAILKSKASRIAGISWAAIGFSYFSGILLLLLFSGIMSETALFVASWLNAIAVPYILFSVYYQWRIAKQWCVLCLSVQAILFLQLAVALAGGWHHALTLQSISAGLMITLAIAFTVPFIFAQILLPALQKAKESAQFKTELQKLKHNKQIFSALLRKQKEVSVNPSGLGIKLGQPDAPFKLIKVCNPYCGPCAEAHVPMEELLHNNPEVQLQVIFTATNDEGDIKTAPVTHLLAIAEQEEHTLKQALDDWYLPRKKDYGIFASKYPMNGELRRQQAKIAAMDDWCKKVRIEFTPTFFVSVPENDEHGAPTYYQLPEIYDVADLKYFFTV